MSKATALPTEPQLTVQVNTQYVSSRFYTRSPSLSHSDRNLLSISLNSQTHKNCHSSFLLSSSFTVVLSLSHTHSLSHTLSLTHALSHAQALSLTHTLFHLHKSFHLSLSLSLYYTHCLHPCLMSFWPMRVSVWRHTINGNLENVLLPLGDMAPLCSNRIISNKKIFLCPTGYWCF